MHADYVTALLILFPEASPLNNRVVIGQKSSQLSIHAERNN